MDYWTECLHEAFDEAGITQFSKDQLELIADIVSGASENFSSAHGYNLLTNPLVDQINVLNEKIRRLEGRVICTKCHGKGYIQENLLNRSSVSRCVCLNGFTE